MKTLIVSAYRWLTRRSGYMILMADDKRLASEPPSRFDRAWVELMLLSLVCGIISAALYGGAWQLFGEYTGMQLMPVAVVVALWALWFYRQAVIALAKLLCGREADNVAVGVSVIVVVLTLSLLGLKSWNPDWPTYLPWQFHWIPRTMFRVLILSPLWGAWAMLIVPQFYKPAGKTEPQLAAMIRGCGPVTAAICMALPLGITLLAFKVFGWWYLTIPAVAILSAVISGLVLCHRAGGLTREALLATNLATQIGFILAYLAMIH